MPCNTFFIQQYCDRCGGELGEQRTISFLTGETLCEVCSLNEDEMSERAREEVTDPTVGRKT